MINERICKRLFLDMLAGVAHIHGKGYVNRDIKLANMFVDPTTFKIKIGDFGFGTLERGKNSNGLLDSTLGTHDFMAPEILQSIPYKGVTADIYSLGITLFLMRCLIYPFG